MKTTNNIIYTGNSTKASDCGPTLVRNVYRHFGVNRHFTSKELFKFGYTPEAGAKSKSLLVNNTSAGVISKIFFKNCGLIFNRINLALVSNVNDNCIINRINDGLKKGHVFAISTSNKVSCNRQSRHVYLLVGSVNEKVIITSDGIINTYSRYLYKVINRYVKGLANEENGAFVQSDLKNKETPVSFITTQCVLSDLGRRNDVACRITDYVDMGVLYEIKGIKISLNTINKRNSYNRIAGLRRLLKPSTTKKTHSETTYQRKGYPLHKFNNKKMITVLKVEEDYIQQQIKFIEKQIKNQEENKKATEDRLALYRTNRINRIERKSKERMKKQIEQQIEKERIRIHEKYFDMRNSLKDEINFFYINAKTYALALETAKKISKEAKDVLDRLGVVTYTDENGVLKEIANEAGLSEFLSMVEKT